MLSGDNMVECIVCGTNLDIKEGTRLNEIIICEECGSELEVISLSPLQVKEAPQEEEDWGE